MQISGGVLPDRKEVPYILEVGRAVRDRLGMATIPNGQAALVPPERGQMEELKEAGWQGVAFNLEVWDPRLWPGIVPGKAATRAGGLAGGPGACGPALWQGQRGVGAGGGPGAQGIPLGGGGVAGPAGHLRRPHPLDSHPPTRPWRATRRPRRPGTWSWRPGTWTSGRSRIWTRTATAPAASTTGTWPPCAGTWPRPGRSVPATT
jgi:hypothetical protein